MHGDLIKKESFIEHDFRIPTVVEEIAVFLPDSAQFDDIDDLLLTIGKQNDRNLLHAFASKLFKVPHRLLVDAEKDREILPKTVADAVSESRRVAKAAEDAVESAILDESEQLSERPLPEPPIVLPVSFERGVKNLINTTIEIADPDYLCDECLPLFGDEIIGTRAEGSPEATPVVHRVGCHHAQRAINRALAESKRHRPGGSDKDIARRVDSVTLRRNVNNRFTGENSTPEVPVTLEWPDAIYPEEHNMSFLCEIVVHCQDRKLLLADCSEIVSELSEIIKTGSLTTNEHATLEFLVNVQSIAHLQKLMNGLRQVRSVMSVERRVSDIRAIFFSIS
jgi:(p)ppGpp synthase/HD superfamily hydrolase